MNHQMTVHTFQGRSQDFSEGVSQEPRQQKRGVLTTIRSLRGVVVVSKLSIFVIDPVKEASPSLYFPAASRAVRRARAC